MRNGLPGLHWLFRGAWTVVHVALAIVVAVVTLVWVSSDDFQQRAEDHWNDTLALQEEVASAIPWPWGGGGSKESAFDDDSSETDTYEDPLDVGIPQENLACTGDYIVLIRSTGDPSTYTSEMSRAGSEASDARYLRTDESCAGFFQDLDGNAIYGAYVGPYGSLGDACSEMDARGFGSARVVELIEDRSSNRPDC